MEKEKQEILEWFIQFANIDISILKPGDKAKFVVEAEEYLYPIIDRQDLARIIDGDYEISVPLLRQERDFLIKLPRIFEVPKGDSPQYWDRIYELQRLVRYELEDLLERSHTPKPYQSDTEMLIERVVYIKRKNLDRFSFTSIPLAIDQKWFLLIRLNLLFDGLPRLTLGKCPGCGKFYLNFTRRSKRYCSPRCMWRVNAEKKREELKKHPKKYKTYLKKQREIMSRKYEERRRTDLGPNVKVRRRKEG